MFSENDFEGGFELNGTQVQIGLGNPASQTVSENGALVDGAAENTFSGSWIAASPIVPVSETIFITEPGSALISDVLDFTYSSNPLNANSGELSGFVISDNDSTPMTVADLNAAGIFATATLSGADGPVGTFPNTERPRLALGRPCLLRRLPLLAALLHDGLSARCGRQRDSDQRCEGKPNG
jgi:hypothetical protein